jgi:tetratricopeptide (TPR) repeat protein
VLWVARLAAAGWLLVAGARAYGDFQAREATEAGIAGRHEEALARVDAAQALPFARGRLLFLRGQILLAAGRYPEAAGALESARQALPHPQVFQALAQVYLAQERTEDLGQLLAQWRAHAPADPALRAFDHGD